MPGIGIGLVIPFRERTGTGTSVPVPIYTDGTEIWRLDVRDDVLNWDYTLTSTGFDGTEDIDWYNAQSES